MKTKLLIILQFVVGVILAQKDNSSRYRMVEDYKKVFYNSCSTAVSELILKPQKSTFERDKELILLCSEIFSSDSVWKNFQRLEKFGLANNRIAKYDTATLYSYILLGKERTNFHIVFDVWTKERKIKKINMTILTRSHTYCNGENKPTLTMFDIFYFEKFLPFIKFNFILRAWDSELYYHHDMIEEAYVNAQ